MVVVFLLGVPLVLPIISMIATRVDDALVPPSARHCRQHHVCGEEARPGRVDGNSLAMVAAIEDTGTNSTELWMGMKVRHRPPSDCSTRSY